MLNYKENPLFKEHEILYFGDNLSGKDYVVGDIHGQFHKLENLLYEKGFDVNKDRLFSAGDLVDRGEEGPARSLLSFVESQGVSHPGIAGALQNLTPQPQ